ncbi:hypothetical protein K432DRAFT_383541 [Lepidopterella palustris CBS 459.81]|uniref:Uncharacterized protein n=1 Tax=Lepidopterella palustris CBS 459.81 TaxID=1314670 RepID=A0A8E2JDR4_9PEZI|nr:hypothetical protein K432DRAFT_383541 [Lepidopterella palustris CBS 459.81]
MSVTISRKSLSPTAQLLRSSRLFSLPPPLHRPSVETNNGGGLLKTSETATLPYPTHQSITTSPSSLARGDWGLKRPLPLKSTTRTSTPAVRISSIDTIEHITDFESAADHTRTLEKWQEMNIPISGSAMPGRNPTKPPPKNAFERHLDSTDPADEIIKVVPGGRRWRTKGPWIAGMQEGEFAMYVQKELSGRKEEFTKYLREYIKTKVINTRRETARSEGKSISAVPEDISEEDYFHNIKLLRDALREQGILSELSEKVITPFLDLPPVMVNDTMFSQNRRMWSSAFEIATESEPPSTHPSAGLSYLRTGAYLTNHPVLGPQAHHPPIPARVLQPRSSKISNHVDKARVGVAGVVTSLDDNVRHNMASKKQSERDVGLGVLDIEAPGGKKVWVHARAASISPEGRIQLQVVPADATAVKVGLGQLVDAPPSRGERARTAGGASRLDDVIPMEREGEAGGVDMKRLDLGGHPLREENKLEKLRMAIRAGYKNQRR